MKKQMHTLPFGRGHVRYTVPAGLSMAVIRARRQARGKLRALVTEALRHPLRSPALSDIVATHRRILIVVPDATRSAHLREILPIVCAHIGGASHRITILVATGLHKEHTRAQLRQLIGAHLMRSCRVICHSQRPDRLMRVGTTSRGVPIVLNRELTRHDCIVSLGVIEPHLYAGYSGGAKTIAIGLAGEETISATHSTRFLDDAHTRLGMIRNNPFQETLWEIVSHAPVAFALNVVNDADGNARRAFAGALRDVYAQGVRAAQKMFEVPVRSGCDIVLCGIGYPKDINLYQASRAINYIATVGRPVVRRGGVIIIAAALRDGIGAGITEKRFYALLRSMRSAHTVLERIRRHGCVAGEHRAYMVAQSLVHYRLILVAPPSATCFLKKLPFPHFTTITDALVHAQQLVGSRTRLAVVPHALATIAQRIRSG